LDALARLGYRKTALFGLCSGAYHAFHAAIADARVGHLVLVNFPMFQWPAGERIENFSFVHDTPQRIVGTLKKAESWRKLLTGQVDVAGRLALQAHWVAAKLKKLGARTARRIGLQPPLSFAQSAAETLARRTRTLILMAPDESGIALLADEFGPDRSPPGFATRIMPDLNHSLTTQAIRRLVADAVLVFLATEPPRAGIE
jgi:hypothetical protein